MELITTPPIDLSPVTDTEQSWQYIEGQDPVDFTGWTAELLIENCGAVQHRTPATLTDDGYITVTVAAATTEALRSARRIDASYQIRFTAPDPNFDMAWQGPVVVQEIIA